MLNILNKAKWLISGNLVFAFSQWLILIMFARMTSSTNLGSYALALAVISPVFAVSNLQLRPLYILDANSENKYLYADFYYLRLICSGIALLISLLLTFFYNIAFFVILLVGLLKFFESYSDIIYSYYNAHDETKLISKSLLIKGLFAIATIFVGLKFFGFYTALMLLLFVYISVWVAIDNLYILKTKEISKFSLNFGIMKSAIPMGISLGIVTLQSSMPRLFLDKYDNISNVGIFTILSYFIIFGSILINSICQYLSPRLTKAWNNSLKEFKKIMMVSTFIAFSLGVVAIIFSYIIGEFILTLFYGENYTQYANELNYIMIAGLFLYLSTVFGYTLTAIGFVKNQIYLFLIILLITISSSYYFIPTYGLNGAISSLTVSYIAQCILSFFVILFLAREKTK